MAGMVPIKGAKFINPTPAAVKLYGGLKRYVACTDVVTANQARRLPYVIAVYAMAGKLKSRTRGW